MEDLEKRLRALELQLALWKGAFAVVTIVIFASLGITAWVSLPKEINRQLTEKVGADTLSRVKQFNEQFASIDANSESAAKKLGLPAINEQLKILRDALGSASGNEQILDERNGNEISLTCPPGTYMNGVSFRLDKGGPHGMISSMKPSYKPFLPR